jgi:8-oxo-dGTP pyrophosphatase MutT (NUDIX family)
MDRADLLALIQAHARRWPADAACADRFAAFIAAHDDCLLRSCRPGHLTGSAWILSPDHAAVLLVHHRKLGRWLQPGGHADGDANLFRVASREAEEETGLRRFTTLPGGDPPTPLDLDIHEIPAHGPEPAHLHLDVRFLLLAAPGEVARASEESTAIRWVPRAQLLAFSDDESLHRMESRTRAVLAGRRPVT